MWQFKCIYSLFSHVFVSIGHMYNFTFYSLQLIPLPEEYTNVIFTQN